MTGKNLPPDTAREISTLKRRVSDLERMLDRVRRVAAPTGTAPLLPPAAWIEGTGYSSAGLEVTQGVWRYYHPANPIDQVVTDPTHHITTSPDQFAGAPWTFRVDVAGLYEFGMSVIFADNAADNHYIGIENIGADGTPLDYFNIISIPTTSTIVTSLSGSRVTFADAGSYWMPIMAEDGATLTGHEAKSFWARAVSLTAPTDPPVGSV